MVDACLVVVTPLLVQRIVDDGILAKDTSLVFELAGLMALTARVRGRAGRGGRLVLLADR